MSWLRVQLGTDLADPVQRLQSIHEQTAAALGPDAPAASEASTAATRPRPRWR